MGTRSVSTVRWQRETADVASSPGRRSSRRLILDAAQACFARYGYDKTTIADISAGAGLTRRTVYQYYPDKGAIWQDAIADVAVRISEALCAVARNKHSAADRLMAILTAAPGLFDDHSLNLHQRPLVALRADGDSQDSVDAFHRTLWSPVADLLIAEGGLAADVARADLVAWLTLSVDILATTHALSGKALAGMDATVRELAIAPLLPADRDICPIANPVTYRPVPIALATLRADRSGAPTVRDRIIEAALLRFSRSGGQEMRVGDVAADADVDRRTVYRHFADRDALIETVTFLEARRVNSQIRRLLVRRADPADIVADAILLAIQLFDRSPLKQQLLAGTELMSAAASRDRAIFPFMRHQWEQLLTRMMQQHRTNPRLGIDAMTQWLMLMQNAFHRSLDIPASDPVAIRRFVRRFPVDALVTDPCAGIALSKG